MKQLACEYAESAKLVWARRQQLRRRLQEGRMGILFLSPREEEVLKNRIGLLELEYWDARRTAKYLANYYRSRKEGARGI